MLPKSNKETIHLSLVNSASFVFIKLCGESNYIPWRTQIVCLLQSHDLFKFVDGTIQEEEKDDYNLQRKMNDELVKACIFGSLGDQLLEDKAIHELDTARQVWLVLEQRYTPKPKFEGTNKIPFFISIYLFADNIYKNLRCEKHFHIYSYSYLIFIIQIQAPHKSPHISSLIVIHEELISK